MKSCSALVVTFLVSLFVLNTLRAEAQCEQRLYVDKKQMEKSADVGSFKLKVFASVPYKGQLIQLQGTNQHQIQSFSGSGTKDFSFKDLELGEDGLFRVIVEFEGEESFLCKKKMLDIEFTDR